MRSRRDPAAASRPAINPGEGAFYGPKFEYVLRDAIGRDWQCGTTQVDFNLPGRLGAFYIDEHGEKKTPVMIHRAIFGSLERFTGILIENIAGHFPLWLAPLQIVVATITSDADDYAHEVSRRQLKRGPARRARPAQREDQLQGARALAGEGAGAARGRQAARPRSARSRSAGSARRRRCDGLDEALTALADEATPPDVRRERGEGLREAAE